MRTSDNGAVPNQIHAYEFEKIIDQQGKNYPFLLDNKEKLMSILTFRIPYFVGPLAKGNSSRFAWLKRKTNQEETNSYDKETINGNIRPWNFEKLIDLDATRKSFIDNLIGNDIILLDKKVLPKRSLVYEEVMLQNELSRVKYKDVNGRTNFIDSDLRQEIVSNLFKKSSKRVGSKTLLSYLQNHTDLKPVEIVAGLEKSFNSSLKTYNDFKEIISEDILNSEEYQKTLEEIIKIITVFEDKKSIKDYLVKYFSDLEFLNEDKIQKLSKLRYTGWGKYSLELLLNIRDEDTGYNLLQFIRVDDRNRNITQLLSDDELSFKRKIDTLQKSISSDNVFDEIRKLSGSPALKRGILNSIKIVDELVGIIGYPPKNIFIEMARDNMTTEEGRAKAKPRKRKLEIGLKKIENDLLVQSGKDKGKLPFSNEQLKSEKLYLYCLQKGKDMYSLDDSGNPEPLHLSQLDQYEVDHIIPYSFLPIDSIDNKVLTRRSNNQSKLDNIPDKKTVYKMKAFWNQLYEAKLISQVKYQRLTTSERTPNGVLTEDMKAGFIERQLVETRQIIKHVARLLNERFEESQIVTLKAQLVTNFRNTFHFAKLRDLNDYHHAHDAYLAVVVGQTLLRAYPKLSPELVYGRYEKKYNRHEANKATLKKHLYSNVMRFFNNPNSKVGKDVWDCERDLPIIKNVLYSSQINFVKRTMVKKGGYYNQNPVGRDYKKIAATNRYPLKTKNGVLNPEIYGGYGPLNSAISVLVAAEKPNKKGTKLSIVKEFHDIQIIDYPKFKEEPMKFLNDSSESGFLTSKGLTRVIAYQEIPKYSLIQKNDGIRVLYESSTNLHKASQFKLSEVQSELFYHMKRLLTKSNFMNLKSEMAIIESQNFIMNHADEIDILVKNLFSFAERQFGNKTVFIKALEAYNNRKYEKIDINETVLSYYYENFNKLFSLVKSGSSSGYIELFESKKIRNADYKPSKKEVNSTLIHQSITGLYETRIDLSKLGEK